jgi:hypothetical protein
LSDCRTVVHSRRRFSIFFLLSCLHGCLHSCCDCKWLHVADLAGEKRSGADALAIQGLAL